MALAMEQARLAEQCGEIPVGAVVVKDGAVIGAGHNRTLTDRDPTAHAEVVAIRLASKAIGNHRLVGCSLYITLEPCAMCMGAVLQSRIEQVYFGAFDPKTGACGSVLNLAEFRQLNPHCRVHGGLSQEACSRQLTHFFQNRRLLKRATSKPLREDALRLFDGQLDIWMGDCKPLNWDDLLSAKGLRVGGWSSPGLEQNRHTLLLCIHGATSWSYIYRDLLLAELPLGTAAWAIDLPGHGVSDKTKLGAELDPAFQFAVLDEILGSCPFRSVHILAHGSGCQFAYDLAQSRKDLVHQVTTVRPVLDKADHYQCRNAVTRVPRSLRQLQAWYRALSGGRADFAEAMCAQYPDAGHLRGFLRVLGEQFTTQSGSEQPFSYEIPEFAHTACQIVAQKISHPVMCEVPQNGDFFLGLPGGYSRLIDLKDIHGNE